MSKLSLYKQSDKGRDGFNCFPLTVLIILDKRLAEWGSSFSFKSVWINSIPSKDFRFIT